MRLKPSTALRAINTLAVTGADVTFKVAVGMKSHVTKMALQVSSAVNVYHFTVEPGRGSSLKYDMTDGTLVVVIMDLAEVPSQGWASLKC